MNDVTGGRDPRVLATLAEALAATGQPGEAARAWDAAIGAATESGDAALAADLAADAHSRPADGSDACTRRSTVVVRTYEGAAP